MKEIDGYIPVLNGVRGLAVLFVLLGHFPEMDIPVIGMIIKKIPGFFHLAYIGVDVFFVLSGFLITRILLKAKERNNVSLKSFWLKRFLRIFPIYYLTVALIYFFIDSSHIHSLLFYYSNFDFAFDASVHPMRHTWSLAIEEHYYVFLPVILMWLNKTRLKNLFQFIIPILVILQLVLLVIYLPEWVKSIDKLTNIRILTLGLGSLMAIREVEVLRQLKYRNQILLVTVGLFLLNACLRFLESDIVLVYGRFLLSACVSVLLILVLINDHYQKRISLGSKVLNSSVLHFIGKISYGVYLYHLPILFVLGCSHMQSYGNVSVDSAIIALALIFGVSYISYKLIEEPLLELKSKIK